MSDVVNLADNAKARISSVAIAMIEAAHAIGATDQETFDACSYITEARLSLAAQRSNVIELRGRKPRAGEYHLPSCDRASRSAPLAPPLLEKAPPASSDGQSSMRAVE